MSKLIVVLVEVVIFASLIAVIAGSASDAQNNLSGAAKHWRVNLFTALECSLGWLPYSL